MKRVIYLIIIVLIKSNILYGQYRMEDIVVNMKNTATLNFNSNIDYVIFGENPQDSKGNFVNYQVFQKDNTCTFKAVKETAPETSIVVRLVNGNIFYGIVKMGSNVKILYDYSNIGKEEDKQKNDDELKENEKKDENKNIKENTKIEEKDRTDERLELIMESKDKYFNMGVKESGITYQIANIKNDSKNTYIKVKVKNDTGNDLVIDGIFMKYFLGKVKGIKKNNAGNEERVTIKKVKGNLVVKAYSEEVIGIVTDLFAVGDKGKLMVRLEEKSGNRTATIEIEGSELQKIDIY